MDPHKILRETSLLYLIREGGAHVGFRGGHASLPGGLRGQKRVRGVTFAVARFWSTCAFAQWISSNLAAIRCTFPEVSRGLLARGRAPSDKGAWNRSVAKFQATERAAGDLVADATATCSHQSPTAKARPSYGETPAGG